jgi:hypothetical protein
MVRASGEKNASLPTNRSFLVASKPNLIEIISICKTKSEYQAAEPNELSFAPGEYIYVIEKDASGWWKGM